MLAGLPVWDVRHADSAQWHPGTRELAASDPGLVELVLSDDQQDPAPQFDPGDPLGPIPVLAQVADLVSYWGDYSAADPLEDLAVLARLRPTAELLATASGCQWWWTPMDRSAQAYVLWTLRASPGDYHPQFSDGHAAAMLSDVERATADDELRMASDRDLPAGTGVCGAWWTHPFPGVYSTTRRVASLGALLLAGQEDGFGDTEALLWPLGVDDGARIYEVDGAAAWQRLVSTYPREATATYRHTWAWTGWDGQWRVPDWRAVARDWDAVHLTVAGYLATAGRALPAGTARTLLAGWNPDETYWLADVISALNEPQHWRTDDGSPLGWRQA